MSLYGLLLKFKLVEQLYPASVAALEYSCYTSEKGLVLKVFSNQFTHTYTHVKSMNLLI